MVAKCWVSRARPMLSSGYVSRLFLPRQVLFFHSQLPVKNASSEPKVNGFRAAKAQRSIEDISNLPSEKESKRWQFSKWVDSNMNKLQATLFTAGQTLNDITGYSGIEKLKQSIQDQEDTLTKCRDEVRKFKEEYSAAIARRSATQREVNELLQRKHNWSPVDLERFTELYRSDHANENEERAYEEKLAMAETTYDEAQTRMTRLISARYHEEQIWSDKIRRASTWGTWGLMGFNVFLFVVVQLGLEPWKRKRLVGSFEEKVRLALEDQKQEMRETHLEKDSSTDLTDREVAADNLTELPAEILESTSDDLNKDRLATATVSSEASSTQINTFLSTKLSNISWRSFPNRILGNDDGPSSLVMCSQQELAYWTGASLVIGAILGSFLTFVYK